MRISFIDRYQRFVLCVYIFHQHLCFLRLPVELQVCGLSTAPQVFTKLLAPILLLLLCFQGIHVLGYLDDILLKEHSVQPLVAHIQRMIDTSALQVNP